MLRSLLAAMIFFGVGVCMALAPDDAMQPAEHKQMSFAQKAAIGGMMEVELGKVAVKQASNADVKAFGQRMIDDHSKANQQLMDLAKSKNIQLLTELPADVRQMVDGLAKMQGDEFDRAYMHHMVADHEKDVKEFTTASNHEADADLKQFAANTLPVLKEHLKLAQEIHAKLQQK